MSREEIPVKAKEAVTSQRKRNYGRGKRIECGGMTFRDFRNWYVAELRKTGATDDMKQCKVIIDTVLDAPARLREMRWNELNRKLGVEERFVRRN